MEYYWEIVLFDDTRVQIPPKVVDVVKRRMNSGEPINTNNEVIPVNQIKAFRITDKPFVTQPLLDGIAQAFDEPQLTEDGIISRWVKKAVPRNKYEKYYAPHTYRKIGEDNGMVVVAFRLPVHEINPQLQQYCTQEEIAKLERY